ncbi:MAG: ATP-dependent DNA helicase RecG [Patescibacteria group bacterium]|nr:ATP-dependent DNA helicase RecG [Patescibacteria group bacterium]
MDLKSPISQIPKIGKLAVKRLEKLGLKRVEDIFYHFPFRYEDWSKILSIAELKAKGSGTIQAKIKTIKNRQTPKKRMVLTEALVSDSTDSIKVVWFNQPFLIKILKPGQEVFLAGKIDYDESFGLQLISPSYEFPKKEGLIHLGRLVPIYPTTEGLSQKQIRFLMKQVLPLVDQIQDFLPDEIKRDYQLMSLPLALEQIHFPASENLLAKAKHRLKFDELFLIQLQAQMMREKLKKQKGLKMTIKLEEIKEFIKTLPFILTQSQKKSAWEILKDLGKSTPMNRLLEGDVGSGKTVVATIAILNVILNNYQVAYLAPTEILASQHFANISELFKNWPIKIGLLTRGKTEMKIKNKRKKIKKDELLEKIKKGEIDLTIGTHALLQEGVTFKKLGLIIVDEQHRFGVEQRAKLTRQKVLPHFLSMTATPIPRSLALTLYGDLDLSMIEEMPPGRKRVEIKIVKPEEKKETYEFIRQEIKIGRQAFVICPLIDPSDKLGVKSVKQEYERLKKEVFPELKLAILHGKMSAAEKERTMRNFIKNKIKILISTSVVEVGIDVPNASIMIIEGAERFGLAQLWQLKGRVGRAEHQSYCFLFSESYSEKSHQRLKALLDAKNGFELAEKDLEMRGPGEIFGKEQSGYLAILKIAKLSETEIVKEAREASAKILSFDPELKKFPLLQKKIKEMTQIVHLE